MRRIALAVFALAGGCHPGGAAQPAARGAAEFSALSVAAWRGDLARVDQLLAAGADPGAVDGDELHTPWTWAIAARELPLAERLLAASRTLPADPLIVRLALFDAISLGDAPLVRQLIRRGAEVDPTDDGHTTPLVLAAACGDDAILRLLLDAGADPARADFKGDTPIAAAHRVGASACVARLVARGVTDPGAPAAPPPAPAPDARTAISRAVPTLQRSADAWLRHTGCTSCHHTPMMERVVARCAATGVAYDHRLAETQRARLAEEEVDFAAPAREALASDDATIRYGMQNGGDVAFGTAWFLTSRLTTGTARGGPEQASAAVLARLQLADGSWQPGPTRGVIESTRLEATALAAHVIDRLGPESAVADPAHRVARARAWLLATAPASRDDRAFLLFGLAWTAPTSDRAAAAARAAEVAALRAAQSRDGSWAHIDGQRGDAYTTGLVLVALHEAGGVPTDDPAYQAGAAFLLATQLADGTWLVPSRAAPKLRFVDGGSPHAKFQQISFAGTAWATLALLEELPIVVKRANR